MYRIIFNDKNTFYHVRNLKLHLQSFKIGFMAVYAKLI